MLSGSRSPVMMTLLQQGTQPFLSPLSLSLCLFSTLRTIVAEVVIPSIVTEWWLRHIYVCMHVWTETAEGSGSLSLSLSLGYHRDQCWGLWLLRARAKMGSSRWRTIVTETGISSMVAAMYVWTETAHQSC